MEVTLLVVTLSSIALAIAMGILTWRLLQEERLRSDARVAALEQGLAETLQDAYVTQQAAASSAAARAATTAPSAPSTPPSVPAAISRVAAPTVTPAPALVAPPDLFARDDTDWLAHFPASTMEAAAAARNGDVPPATDAFAANDVSRAARPLESRPLAAPATNASNTIEIIDVVDDADAVDFTDPVDDVMADSDAVENANGGLFGQITAHDDRSEWSRRALAIAPWAAVMLGAVIAFWTIGRLMEPPANRAGTAVARAGVGAGGGAVANSAAATALELMSLRQEMTDGTLTISGLVRNPRGGVTQEKLTAVVFFFDGQGGFLSSTRAPLDYQALAPGEESPFQLAAPAPAGVARYRVSFRRDEGAVVPHVDRRQQVQQSLHNPQEASRS